MDLLQGLTASILVLLALSGTLVLLRSRGLARFGGGGGNASKRLEAIERLTLTPQHALHLVRIDDKLLIVSSAPGGCSIIGPIQGAEKTA